MADSKTEMKLFLENNEGGGTPPAEPAAIVPPVAAEAPIVIAPAAADPLGTPMEQGGSEAVDEGLGGAMNAAFEKDQAQKNAVAAAAHAAQMKDPNNPPPINSDVPPVVAEPPAAAPVAEAPPVVPPVADMPPVTPPAEPASPVGEPPKVEEDKYKDVDALLDEIMNEPRKEGDPPEVKEEVVEKTNKSNIVTEEVEQELEETKKTLRQTASDNDRHKSQAQHRKGKTEELTNQYSDLEMKYNNGANISPALKTLAKTYSSWESAEDPSTLDMRHVLQQLAIVYKDVTGQSIDDVVNGHLGLGGNNTQTTHASSGAPMDGSYASQSKKASTKSFIGDLM